MLSTFLSMGVPGPLNALAEVSPERAEPAPQAGANTPADGAIRGDRKKREEQAFRLYQSGRYAEAALEFEALWQVNF